MLPIHRRVDPDNPLVADFRNFLFVVFNHLRPGKDPTPAQYRMAEFLQHGWGLYGEEMPKNCGRLDLIEAFRGVGKSELLATYALWLLYRNPEEEKVLVMSATSSKAKKFVAQTKRILLTLPLLAHLRPRTDQRDMFDAFDVNGASNTQSPSVQAQGISGQITGDRATTIIADDIEIPENSRTEERRVILAERTLEFSNIILPHDENTGFPGGDIIFLGTPQSEESIYTVLVKERHYRAWVWPARYPSVTASQHYVLTTKQGKTIDILSPDIRKEIEANDAFVDKPTDTRFDDFELRKRENQGRANWMLQFMLDTSLCDEERFPLKLRNLMVFPCNDERAPRLVHWGRDTDKKNFLRDIPNSGFSGDYWLAPMFRSPDTDWTHFDTKAMFVDTAGRGADETAWAVVAILNGTFWVLDVGGMSSAQGRMGASYAQDAYDTIMVKIAQVARKWGVEQVVVETNFAEGLWAKAFLPVLKREWPDGHGGTPCGVEEVRVHAQKEVRICDTLEPVFNNHRMVFNDHVARDEELGYQITHITRERGSLKKDDRVDALAGAVGVLQEFLTVVKEEAAKDQEEALRDRELRAFVEAFQTQNRETRYFRLPKENLRSEKDWDAWEESWSIRSRTH